MRGWWRRRRLARSLRNQEIESMRLTEFLRRLGKPEPRDGCHYFTVDRPDAAAGLEEPTRRLPVIDPNPLLTRAAEVRAGHAVRRLLP